MLAPPALLIAFVFQALGYTGTCTQGANGPFLSGVVLSFPLLLMATVLLARTGRRLLRSSTPQGSMLDGLASLVAMIVASWMVYFNSTVGFFTLWLGLGPCGPDHTPIDRFDGQNIAVGLVFAAIPAAIAVLALLTIRAALPARSR